jgi:hypothetical protein
MNYEAVKEKLHDLIEHAGEDKIMAIYTLLSGDAGSGVIYDEATLNLLEATRNNMLSGKEKVYTLEQTIENIRKHRSQNGI